MYKKTQLFSFKNDEVLSRLNGSFIGTSTLIMYEHHKIAKWRLRQKIKQYPLQFVTQKQSQVDSTWLIENRFKEKS